MSLPPPLPCTGARLRRLARRTTVFYEHYLRTIGLKLGQYSMLAHLDAAPQSLQVLADRLEMDRTTLSRGLKPLVAAGWVAPCAGEDARQRCFALTAEGEQMRIRANAVWREAQQALEASMGRDFVALLNDTLDDGLARIKPSLPEEN